MSVTQRNLNEAETPTLLLQVTARKKPSQIYKIDYHSYI